MPPVHQAVILKHTLPDGSSHFDWMIDQPELVIENRLLTWRCQDRPDQPRLDQLVAIQLPNHRAKYLDYQGEISRSRGSVIRVAQGIVDSLVYTPESIEVMIKWEHSTVGYQGCSIESSKELWQFSVHKPTSPLDE